METFKRHENELANEEVYKQLKGMQDTTRELAERLRQDAIAIGEKFQKDLEKATAEVRERFAKKRAQLVADLKEKHIEAQACSPKPSASSQAWSSSGSRQTFA